MSYNVLIGVPKDCPPMVAGNLEVCLRSALREIDEVNTVCSEVDYLHELIGRRGYYNVTIAVDALGQNTMYVPYLQGGQRVNPDLMVIVVVPDSCKGTTHMSELLGQGLFNALYLRELNKDNIYQLVNKPRDVESAALYYGVDLAEFAKSFSLVRYGYRFGETGDSGGGIVTRMGRNGITISRGTAADFGKGRSGSRGTDEDMLSFFDNEGLGIENSQKLVKRIDFAIDEEWVERYKQALTRFYRDKGLLELQAFEKGTYTESEFRSILAKKMTEQNIPAKRQKPVADAFIRDIVSYGKLDVVLNTDGISDIKLNSKDSVTVQYKGEWYNTNIRFATVEEFSYFVNKICTKNRAAVNINATQAIFSDIETNAKARLRITVSHKSINTSGLTTAAIRKIDKIKKTVAQLISEGYWTKEQAAFLVHAVRQGKTILFSGGSGSGKTIGMNCSLEYLPNNIVGVGIQEAEELFTDGKPNIEWQHTIVAKGENKVGVALKELATQGLLKNAQVFIVGEIKGNEAEDFLTIVNTGAQGFASLHANSIFDVLERLADLARGAGYEQDQMLRMLARNVDIIVGLDHYKVDKIAQVVGWDEKRNDVVYDVYNF